MAERAAPGQGGIIALGEKKRRNMRALQPFDAARDVLRPKAPRIHQKPCVQRHVFVAAADMEPESLRLAFDAPDMCAPRQHRARGFRAAQQRQHILMAVDDAGGRRQQCQVGAQFRLEGRDLAPRQRLQIVHAVIGRHNGDGGQSLFLSVMRGDQLADPTMSDAVADAKVIKQRFSRHAQPPLQRSRRIIKARMDHFAVAGAGFHPGMIVLFQDQGVMARQRQAPCHGKAHRAGADHCAIAAEMVHGRIRKRRFLLGSARSRRNWRPSRQGRVIHEISHHRSIDPSGRHPCLGRCRRRSSPRAGIS
jgi:hypothetical protein